MFRRSSKQLLTKLHPELYTLTDSNDEIKEQIKRAGVGISLEDDFLYKLIDSMPARVEGVIKANGGYTHY